MSQALLARPTEEVAEFFAHAPSVEDIAAFQLSDGTIARVRELLHKNAGGMLSREESEELDQLALLDRIVILIRSRLPRSETQPAPA